MDNESISMKEEIGKYLSIVNYPAEKSGIIKDVEKVGADIRILLALEDLPLQKYHTPREVISEIN